VRAREQGRPSFGASPNLESTFEIKSSVADFISRPLDKLFFVIPESVPIEIMPEDAGPHFGRCLWCRDFCAWANRMASATRRAMPVRFAHAAAHRLHRLSGREWPKATDALHVWIEVMIIIK